MAANLASSTPCGISAIVKLLQPERSPCLTMRASGTISQRLEQYQPQEAGVVQQIPAPQAPWLCHKTKRPLQAASLHPARSLLFYTRMKVKSCPYPNCDRSCDATEML